MSTQKSFHCIVDDTVLITNISEIESWVMQGTLHLVVPLHTLERLRLLKKDTSQIGQNAKKAVKFLDEATSNPESSDRVVIQGPDDRYPTWAEVEAHYLPKSVIDGDNSANDTSKEQSGQKTPDAKTSVEHHQDPRDDLSHIVLSKMHVTKDENAASPLSTPPLSPSSSGPLSSKTSPEIKTTSVATVDSSPVPQTLKPLINPVVWYTQKMKNSSAQTRLIYLTNSSDNCYLARDFGVTSNNIHQLRASIGVEEQEAKNHEKFKEKLATSPKRPAEPRTLFRYEDEESEEEEVIFKPRGRGAHRSNGSSRGGNTGSVRSRKGPGHSPANSLSAPQPPTAVVNKPQIPTEEIDPDSFDRGSFGRGSTPLASVGNTAQIHQPFHGQHRGHGGRGQPASGGPSRGGFSRGRGGFDRGASRGRGRLFVP